MRADQRVEHVGPGLGEGVGQVHAERDSAGGEAGRGALARRRALCMPWRKQPWGVEGLADERRSEAVPAGRVLRGLARAFGGALIFAVPMLMTEELWNLGAALDRRKLALMVLLAIPLLVGVAHRVGFEASFGWREDLRDAFIALGVGLVAAAVILATLGVIGEPPLLDQAIGRVAIQAVPAALGALLARSQLARAGEGREERERARAPSAATAARSS